MEWKGRQSSRNVEDRRRVSGARVGGIGGIGLVAVLLIGWFLGVDVTPLLQDQGGISQGSSGEVTAEDEERGEFVTVVLKYTEDVWAEIFADQVGKPYVPATLVLFKGSTPSQCGVAGAASGPFYCPPDQKVYLDTDFFVTMSRQLGADGDFAAAYVVAHEIAHHVQNQLGILGKVNQLRAKVSEADSNALSVKIELQADCLSGVWARMAQNRLGVIEAGDFEEALNAARRIGDDVLQKAAGRTPMPHTFTHGTAEQRARWFLTGLKSGRMEACDTFGAGRL